MEEEQLKTYLSVGNFKSQFPSLQLQDKETNRPNGNSYINTVSKQPLPHPQQNQNISKDSRTSTNYSHTP